MNSSGLLSTIKRALGVAEKIHPIDRRLAKRWIKQRLMAVYPELRSDPKALEEAYQSLSLEPRAGTEEGDAGTYFEIKLPRG